MPVKVLQGVSLVELRRAFNDWARPLTTLRPFGFVLAVRDAQVRRGREYRLTVSYDTAGSAMSSPYRLSIYEESSPVLLQAALLTAQAAAPTNFWSPSPIAPLLPPQVPPLFVGALVTCADAVDGQANWAVNPYSASGTNTGGLGGDLTGTFDSGAAPALLSASPNNGTFAGGTSVTLTGANLTGVASVTFGGFATVFTVVNSTTITATTPPYLLGGQVNVVARRGGQTGTLVNGFLYVSAPTLTAIATTSPTFGPTTGGTVFVVQGTNLTGATWTVGGAPVVPLSSSDTSATLASPALAQGFYDIVATNAAGSATLTGAWLSIPMLFWLRYNFGQTDDGSGFCSQWADQSGNTRNFSQGSAGARPQITANGLLFDGGDLLDGPDIAPPTAYSAVIAARQTAGAATFQAAFGQYNSTGNQRALVLFSEASNFDQFIHSELGTFNANFAALGSVDRRGTWAIRAGRWQSGGQVQLLVNGLTQQAISSGSPTSLFNSTASWAVGGPFAGSAANLWLGEIAEVLYASARLTDVEALHVQQNINARAGLGLVIT